MKIFFFIFKIENSIRLSFFNLFFSILSILLNLIGCMNTKETLEASEKKIRKKLIILSIDGFPGYYASEDSEFWKKLKYLPELKDKSSFSNRVASAYPTLTFPAHTTMVTGVSPSKHGIYYNTPPDPMRKFGGEWYYYDEDIKVKTLYDFAREKKLITGNIYWPVTVGAGITYNVPQYYRFKNEYDSKILSALSTRGLYRYLNNKIDGVVAEHTGDEEKINAAIALWELKEPDLLFIYTTDLDTVHHEKGVYTPEAFEKLNKIDRLLGNLIKKIKLYERKELGLIVVSDHGFKKVESLCYPNKILIDEGLIDPSSGKWSFVFKGLGGSAVLLENKDRESYLKGKVISLPKIAEKIQELCPGSIAEHDSELFQKVSSEISSDIRILLHSLSGMAFSESLTAKESFRVSNPPYYNHGFLPTDPELETIGLYYGGTNMEKISSLKDIFFISCKHLNLDCKAGEKRN